MEPRVPITVIIAVRNEEKNIARCLDALQPAERLVVVDSGSTDRTVELSKERRAEVLQFKFTGGYPKKRQWALDTLEITTPWVLLIDADEVIPPKLWEEIRAAVATPTADAYLITKGYHFLGKAFAHGGFSFDALLLFRKGTARFEKSHDGIAGGLDMEVHERLIVDGKVGKLPTPLIHEDFKGLEAYIDRHNKYSSWEAKLRFEHARTGAWAKDAIEPKLFGNAQERRRFLKGLAVRVPFEPQLWFLYHYVARLGFLEGRPGLIASQIRGSYIAQVRAKLWELRHAKK